MLTTLTLAAAMVAAPVPRDTKPAGPAPRVLDLGTDADGKVRVPVVREVKRKLMVGNGAAPNGQPVEREITSRQQVRLELAEIKDLTVSTVDGKEVDLKEAAKRLSGGGIVLASADGAAVDPKFLKLFKDDVLVLKSPELVTSAGPPANGGAIGVINGNIQVLPGAVPGGGGIQIQIVPGANVPAILPVAPPQAAPAPAAPDAK